MKTTRHWLSSGLLLAMIAACDGKPAQLKFTPTGAPIPEVVVSEDGKAKPNTPGNVQGTKEELPLELVLGPGSNMRFVDGKALSIFYSNIFTKRAYGYEHCNNITDINKLPLEAAECTDTIFSAAERPLMGAFEVNLSKERGAQNVTPPHNLTLNYMKTLRAALARECQVLVTAERANIKTNNSAAGNKLVKGASPTAADLDEFFRTILGIKGSGMKVNVASDAYVGAFTQIVAAASAADKEKAIDQAYLGLCVAIAMNPQIIIY